MPYTELAAMARTCYWEKVILFAAIFQELYSLVLVTVSIDTDNSDSFS